MDIKDIYKQLTSVDIEEQKRLWDERGKGYYGEYLVFCELYKKISGNCKILMNLNVPTETGKTTEIDLLLIHETGIYVFEVKHYKGTIYGDDKGQIWTQYFRTAKNNTFRNPMLQNEYHIKAVKNLFPSVPLRSIIIFTNYDCDIRVKNSNNNIDLCNLNSLNKSISHRINSAQQKYSMEEIDVLFNELSKYSQMQEIVEFEGKEESFISWLQPIISELEKEKKNVAELSNKTKRSKRLGMRINIVIAIMCILFSIGYTTAVKGEYNLELDNIKNYYNGEIEEFKQKFKHVDEIENKYIDIVNEYVDVTNVSLTDNAVTFSAKLSVNTDKYGIALTKDSKYIVMTNAGQVLEYDVFGKHLAYYRYTNMIGKGIRDYGNLAQAKLYGVSKDDISYIKLINIELFKLDSSRTIVKENLEIELYNKSDSK